MAARRRTAAKSPVPIEDLPPAARAEIVEAARDLRRIIGLTARNQRQAVEDRAQKAQPGRGFGLDSDTALAVLRYTQALNQLVAAYPGLEKLLHGDNPDGVGAGSPIAGEDAARSVLDALRAGGHPDPG